MKWWYQEKTHVFNKTLEETTLNLINQKNI